MAGRPGPRAARPRPGGAGGGAAPDGGDTFRVPPVPLASGDRLPDPDGRGVRSVELVVTTEDGDETHIALVPRHGAWWAPAAPRA